MGPVIAGLFNNHRFCIGYIQSGRQFIIGKIGIEDLSLIAHKNFFGQGKTDPHGNAALDLTFNGDRVDGFADIMGGNVF